MRHSLKPWRRNFTPISEIPRVLQFPAAFAEAFCLIMLVAVEDFTRAFAEACLTNGKGTASLVRGGGLDINNTRLEGNTPWWQLWRWQPCSSANLKSPSCF